MGKGRRARQLAKKEAKAQEIVEDTKSEDPLSEDEAEDWEQVHDDSQNSDHSDEETKLDIDSMDWSEILALINDTEDIKEIIQLTTVKDPTLWLKAVQ